MQLQEGLAENSDNEGIEDEPVAFDQDDLLAATLTHVKGSGKMQEEETQGFGAQLEQEDEDNAREGNARLYALTLQMLHISDKVWASAENLDGGDLAMQQIHQAMMEAKSVVCKQPGWPAHYRRTICQAARAGDGGQIASVAWKWPSSPQHKCQATWILGVGRGQDLGGSWPFPPEESSRQTAEPLVWLLHLALGNLTF